MEANLRYSQQVPEGFRITKATLNPDSSAAVLSAKNNLDPCSKLVQVFVEIDGSDYAICTLKHGEIYDCSVDLRFAEGEDVCFYLKGEGVVFLTGYNLYSDDADGEFYPHDASAISDDSSNDDIDDDDDEDDDDDDDDSSDDDGPQIEDITELAAAKAKRDSGKTLNGTNGTSKALASAFNDDDDDDDDEDNDQDFDEDASDDVDDEDDDDDDDEDAEDDDDEDDDDDDDDDEEDVPQSKLTPGQKRTGNVAHLKSKIPDAKKAKLQENGDAAKKTPQSQKKPQVFTSSEAVKQLHVEDLKIGSGPVASKGKTVHVYYKGTLLDGKTFDSQLKGKPFQFKLGTASVIKGWDKGLEGMKVGGKRRLVIPASMAYGKRSMGPIPANSALKFEVELKAVSG